MTRPRANWAARARSAIARGRDRPPVPRQGDVRTHAAGRRGPRRAGAYTPGGAGGPPRGGGRDPPWGGWGGAGRARGNGPPRARSPVGPRPRSAIARGRDRPPVPRQGDVRTHAAGRGGPNISLTR